MVDAAEYHGSLVAFEGPAETITTQLHLLPRSSQILILPTIQHYLAEDPQPHPSFDARAHIRRVHEATAARTTAAVEFLRGSTSFKRRLVFLNGGTAGAQALCISAISECETSGDVAAAESIFHDVVRNGVAGLEADEASERRTNYCDQEDENEDEECEDPIIRAMREADVLDRETASLQPCSDLDPTTNRRLGSTGVPAYDTDNSFDDATPFYGLGARTLEDFSPVDRFHSRVPELLSPNALPVQTSSWECPPGINQESIGVAISPSETRFLGNYCDTRPPPSVSSSNYPLVSEAFMSRSETPGSVVFGQARVVQMRPSILRTRLQQVRSVDETNSRGDNQQFREHGHAEIGNEVGEGDDDAYRHRGLLDLKDANAEDPFTSESAIRGTPRMMFVRATQTTIQRSPTIPSSKAASPLQCYVDRGTDAADFSIPEMEVAAQGDADEFEAVLPLVEDLVIYFSEDSRDELLESVIKGFRTGSYPVLVPSSASSEINEECGDSPTTPRSTQGLGGESVHIGRCPSPEVRPDSFGSGGQDTYPWDMKYGYYTHQLKPNSRVRRHITEARDGTPEPPTPAETPSLVTPEPGQRFHIFSAAGQRTPVCVQNSLRCVLSTYFPSGDEGYKCFRFPLLPELDHLWQPVFQRPSKVADHLPEERIVDLILAIGAQNGVRKEYLSAVRGQIEKLGTKPNGASRSGRLDLRYLIANAMQTFTAQPLTHQTHDNPLSNSVLLATLMIPHLEMFLAANAGVRFLLLEYPAEHLATVLALQKLIGSDLVQVAGIVDASDSVPAPLFHRKQGSSASSTRCATESGSPPSSPISTTHPQHRHPWHRSQASGDAAFTENLSFSRANFLLTSSATESETAAFIASVCKVLVAASPFYVPEHAPPRRARSTHNLAQQNASQTWARTSSPSALDPDWSESCHRASVRSAPLPLPSLKSTKSSSSLRWTPAVPDVPPLPPRPASPSLSARSKLSAAEAIRTWRTGRSRGKEKPRSVKDDIFMRGEGDYIEDWDSEYEFDERRLMPLYRPRRVPAVNSRKALKWLGLA